MSDAQLEAMIEHAGREKVFAIIRAAGWGQHSIPRWVWERACHMALNPDTADTRAANIAGIIARPPRPKK